LRARWAATPAAIVISAIAAATALDRIFDGQIVDAPCK
jgi:hypothetical protein